MDYFHTLIQINTAYVDISEELDEDEACTKLGKTFELILKDTSVSTIILNFGQISRLNSYGVAQLILGVKGIRKVDGGKLKAHSTPYSVQEVLEMVMLDRVIEEDDSVWPRPPEPKILS